MSTIFMPGGEDPSENTRWEKTTARAQGNLENAAPDDAESFVEASEHEGRIVINGSVRPPFDMDEFCRAIWNAIDTLKQSNGQGKAHISRNGGSFQGHY